MQQRPYRWLWISLLVGFFLAVGNFIGQVPSYVSASGPQNSPQQEDLNPIIQEPESELADGDQDPDLPGYAKGKISKSQYLKLRQSYLGKLRGLPHKLPYEPRSLAIRQMEQMEQEGRRRGLVPNINSSTWTPIGPAPIPNGQTSPSVAVSGRVTCIAPKPGSTTIIYVGTAQGGVYRTTDGGTTWTPIFDTAQSLSVGSIGISANASTTIFVGTGEPSNSCDSYAGVGLYRITNAESASPTLTLLGTAEFDRRAISKVIVDPANANNVFVSTVSAIRGISCSAPPGTLPTRGVYRSTNALGGSPTFTLLNVPTTPANRPVTDMVIDPNDANRLICAVAAGVAADAGIWLSTNALGGTPTFTRTLALATNTVVTLAANNVSSQVNVFAASSETSGTAACTTAGDAGRLRRSTDGGATWSAPLTNGEGFCGGQCGYDQPVGVSPTDGNILLLGGNVTGTCSFLTRRSTNALGATPTFTDVSSSLHADMHAFAFADSNTVFLGNDGGIWKSVNAGVTWTTMNNSSFNATQFQSLALHSRDRQFMIGGTQDNGTNYLQTTGVWSRADSGDGGFALIDQSDTGLVSVRQYHTYFNAANVLVGYGTRTSVAATSAWTFRGDSVGACTAGNGITCTDNVLFYAPMALGPGTPNPVYYGTDRLYRSVDAGLNNTVVSTAPISGTTPLSAIGISPANDNVRIVGLSNGGIFRTTTGANPTDADSGGAVPNRYVARAVVDPQNVDTAFVTLSGFAGSAGQNVWRTTNLSAATPTWTNAGTGIPDVPVNAFVVDPNSPVVGNVSQYLYAGTDIGVFRSTDGGTSWNPYSNGLPRVAVFDMAIQATNRILRIATHGRGIWEIIPDNFTNTTVSIINVNPTYIAPNATYTGGQINVAADLRNTGASNLNSRVYFRITDLSKVPVDATQLELTTAANGAGKNDDIQNILTSGSLAPSTNMTVSGGFNIGRDTPVTPVRLFGDVYTTALTGPQATKIGTFQFNTSDFVRQRAQFGVNHIESESRFDLVQNQEYPVIAGIGAQSTAVIAIDPKNSQRMAVASEDIRTHTIIVRLSDNGGNSWRTTVVNPTVGGTTYYGAHHPSLAFSPTGELYVTFVANNLEDSGCAVALVTTGDRLTLGSPTALASYTAADRRIASRPTVAVSPDGRATVAWDVFNATTGQFEIQVGRGRKLGDQGGTPVVTVAQGTVAAPTLTFGPKGNLLVGWLEWDASLKADQGGRVRVATSADGVTFEPAVTLGETGIGFGRVMGAMPDRGAGPNLSLAVDKNGSVYASYAGAGEGMDLYLVRSDDNGRSWSAPTVVNDITKGDQFHPALAVDASGTVVVSYYDTRNSSSGGEVDVYLARSTNRGVSFGASERVTTRSSNDSVTNPTRDAAANLGSRIGVAATANGVFLVWTDTRNGNEDVYFSQRASAVSGSTK